MTTKTRQTCPRCARPFYCRPEAISRCQCSQVILSEAQRRAIQQQYQACLCADCLQGLSEQIKA